MPGYSLPHPYVRRLYRQRGVFVEPVSEWPLRKFCVEIRFPPDPRFEVLRDDMKRPELLPTDEWWLLLIEVARRIVAGNSEQKLRELKSGAPGITPGWELFSFILGECGLTTNEENLLINPHFLCMDAKQAQLVECAGELFNIVLRNSGPTLVALLPLVQRLVSGLPTSFVLRTVAEAMMATFVDELKTHGHSVLGKGWQPRF